MLLLRLLLKMFNFDFLNLSTLFIKQHVYYDVISAFFIVIVYNFIYEKCGYNNLR